MLACHKQVAAQGRSVCLSPLNLSDLAKDSIHKTKINLKRKKCNSKHCFCCEGEAKASQPHLHWICLPQLTHLCRGKKYQSYTDEVHEDSAVCALNYVAIFVLVNQCQVPFLQTRVWSAKLLLELFLTICRSLIQLKLPLSSCLGYYLEIGMSESTPSYPVAGWGSSAIPVLPGGPIAKEWV